MSAHIKYAQLRHNTWVYRRTYPKALQPLLGTALKRSLKTSDARDAKARVDELNITFDRIVAEATAHAALLAANPADTEALRLGVASPRYLRARLLGDRAVDELVGAYLQRQAKRLRPGSFKSVRFAMGLLVSELGKRSIGSITVAEGRQVLRYIAELSPNIRKYRVARGKTLAELAALSQDWKAYP